MKNYIFTILLMFMGISSSILFWIFLFRGDVYEDIYPLVGHLVASHGLLVASIVMLIKIKK